MPRAPNRMRTDVTVNRIYRSIMLGLASTALLAVPSFAQTTAPSSSAQQPSLLQQISRETQALFESVRPSLVVVQLPPPRWATALMQEQQNQLLQKWGGQIDPRLQKRLQEETQVGAQGNVDATINATNTATQPGEQPQQQQPRQQLAPDNA